MAVACEPRGSGVAGECRGKRDVELLVLDPTAKQDSYVTGSWRSTGFLFQIQLHIIFFVLFSSGRNCITYRNKLVSKIFYFALLYSPASLQNDDFCCCWRSLCWLSNDLTCRLDFRGVQRTAVFSVWYYYHPEWAVWSFSCWISALDDESELPNENLLENA